MATRLSAPSSESPSRRLTEIGQNERSESMAMVLRWTLLGLCVAAFLALVPLWVPLLLAAWTALVVQPLHRRLVGKLGPGRSAGALTVLLFVLALAPIVVIALSVTGAAVELAHKLQSSGGGRNALRTLLATEPNLSLQGLDARRVIEMTRQHGAGALNAATTIFGAATAVIVGVVVYLFGLYTYLVNGRRIYGWVLDHSPLPRRYMVRLSEAFVETGKGLFIGIGLTALLQGAVATVGYVIIGVPQALVLGLLTVFAALIPSIGTGLVWVPVTIGLFLDNQTGAGIALLVLGCVVSVVDNFARPALSRYGHLDLPMFVVFVAMLGGIAAFGAWGLLVGPLFVRLAVEALRIWREEHDAPVVLR
ncbi:MAG TPA: AI-2E family transporter [Polyangiaceae bacterium]